MKQIAEVFPISNKTSWQLGLLAGALLLTAGCSGGKSAATNAPSLVPTNSPVATGGSSPSALPSASAGAPAASPSASPTAQASVKPTAKPSEKPTPKPTAKPTAKPAVSPKPSAKPADGDAVTTIAKPAEIAVWVNKSRKLPADYVPSDLTEPNVRFSFSEKLEKRQMRKEAAAALERLFVGAKKDGVTLYAVSGYRSYKTQASLFSAYVKRDGEAEASRYSARAGTSEHQTGLAMDVSSESVNFKLTDEFGNTAEGKWLAKHAPEYGFIIRYPKGTEKITGYMYEPWHIRYLGKELAQEVAGQGVTLDEYFNHAIPVNAP